MRPVEMRLPTVAVLVAVREARERLPEKRAFPWTERFCDGEVVPIPTRPLARMLITVTSGTFTFALPRRISRRV